MAEEDKPDFQIIVSNSESEEYGRIVKAVINDKWQTVISFFKKGVSIGVDKEFFQPQNQRTENKRVMVLTHAEFKLVKKLEEVYKGKNPRDIDWSDTPFNFEDHHENVPLETVMGAD